MTRAKTTPSVMDDRELTLAFLNIWTATQQLWLASRQGAMAHQIAGPLAAAHAAIDRAVVEAEKAGMAVVERGPDGVVIAIRAPGGTP